MKLLILIVLIAAWLFSGSILSAQDQTPPGAPTSPPAQSAPSPQPPAETAPATSPTAAPPSAEPQDQTPSPATKPTTPAPKPAKKKPAGKASASGHKVVVRNGGAKDVSPQLAPGMSKEQELHSREATTQLLATTDVNVKSVAGRQLTPAQQGLLDQIHTYMKQSKEASESGDLTRAHTLAYKAHLLSDELRK
jgi:hypothetical protein